LENLLSSFSILSHLNNLSISHWYMRFLIKKINTTKIMQAHVFEYTFYS
jgi:hypothetical protein